MFYPVLLAVLAACLPLGALVEVAFCRWLDRPRDPSATTTKIAFRHGRK